MNELALVNQTAKSQAVRLVDVFVLGPFMGWAALVLWRDGKKAMAIGMGAAAVGTVFYNGRNYLRMRAAQR